MRRKTNLHDCQLVSLCVCEFVYTLGRVTWRVEHTHAHTHNTKNTDRTGSVWPVPSAVHVGDFHKQFRHQKGLCRHLHLKQPYTILTGWNRSLVKFFKVFFIERVCLDQTVLPCGAQCQPSFSRVWQRAAGMGCFDNPAARRSARRSDQSSPASVKCTWADCFNVRRSHTHTHTHVRSSRGQLVCVCVHSAFVLEMCVCANDTDTPPRVCVWVWHCVCPYTVCPKLQHSSHQS